MNTRIPSGQRLAHDEWGCHLNSVNVLKTHAALESTNASRAQALMEVIAVAGFVALCAQVRIPLPFTPVPVTLSTLAVLMAPFAVGARRATAGFLLYTILGLMGTPVFAVSFGPTFGYILGYLAVPAVMSQVQHPARALFAGTATIYLVGLAWFCYWMQMSPLYAFLFAIVPFVPVDALKVAVAYQYARRCGR